MEHHAVSIYRMTVIEIDRWQRIRNLNQEAQRLLLSSSPMHRIERRLLAIETELNQLEDLDGTPNH